jgi:AcrR family transcriptional regulator
MLEGSSMVTQLRRKKDSERKQRTRESLLDAAEKVLTEQGYHSTLISDIVRRAGVGQGTFYRHFDSKREILQTLFDRFVQHLVSQFDGMTVNLPGNDPEYRAASAKAISKVAANIDQHRGIALLFFREGPSIDREFEQSLDTVYERFAQLAQFYLDHAIRSGFARRCNSRLVSQALVGVGQRMLNLRLSDRLDEFSLQDLIEEVVEFAFTGFGMSNGATGDAGHSDTDA